VAYAAQVSVPVAVAWAAPGQDRFEHLRRLYRASGGSGTYPGITPPSGMAVVCATDETAGGLQNDEKRALYEQHGHRMQPSTQELSWDKCVWRVSSARRRIRIASAFQVGRGGLGATEGLHTPVVRSQPHEHGGLESDAVARFGSGWKTADSGVSCQWTSLWSSAHLRSLCAPPDQCAARQRRDLVLSPHVVA